MVEKARKKSGLDLGVAVTNTERHFFSTETLECPNKYSKTNICVFASVYLCKQSLNGRSNVHSCIYRFVGTQCPHNYRNIGQSLEVGNLFLVLAKKNTTSAKLQEQNKSFEMKGRVRFSCRCIITGI